MNPAAFFALQNADKIFKVITTVAMLGAGIWLFKKLSKSGSEYPSQARSEVIKSDLRHSQSDYTRMAQQLFTAIDGCTVDYPSVIGTLKLLQTKSDWLMTVAEYGNRTKTCFFSSDMPGDLVMHLQDELTESRLSEANMILSKIGVQLYIQ